MATAMSMALAKAGVISEQQTKSVEAIPHHLKPYASQLQEMTVLGEKLDRAGVKQDVTDVLVSIMYQQNLSSGRFKEGVTLMLEHMRKKAHMVGLA